MTTPPPPDHASQPPLAEGEREALSGAALARNELIGVIGEAIMDGCTDYPPFPAMPSDVAWMVAKEVAARLESHGVVLGLATLAQMTRERDAAVAERDEAREVVAKVNNSFGSYAYFTKPHPAGQVEELKEQCRKEWLRANAAVAREARLRETLQSAIETMGAAFPPGHGWRQTALLEARAALASTSEPEGGK